MNRGRDIIPSNLMLRENTAFDNGDTFDNYLLRFGEVQEIIYPDSDRSKSKTATEYNVFVQHSANGTGVGVIYNNCLISNLFGGVADEVRFTLRAPSTPSSRDRGGHLGLGSKVLILCQNGERSNAYIVGGKFDFKNNKTKDDKDLGHHYSWTFNGINVSVDKDGQYRITYTGKSDIDGSRNSDVKDDQIGTFFELNKDGNATLADKDQKNMLLIDHKNSKVVIKRDTAFELGDATDKMLLGESFRNAQQQMHDQLKSYLKTAKNLLQTAGTEMTSAGGSIVGAFIGAAAGPHMVTAGTNLLAAANIMEQMGQAIDKFEQTGQSKNSYLSKKNKSD